MVTLQFFFPLVLLHYKILAWRRKDEGYDSCPLIFQGPACGSMISPILFCSRDKTRTYGKISVIQRSNGDPEQ